MAMMILIFKATLGLRKNLVWYVIDKDKGVCGPIVGLGDASKPIKQFLKDTIGNTIVKHALIRISSPHRSWPAVSQICSLIFSPSISTVLIIKSTPMVAPCPGGNMPWKWHSYFSREEWVTNKQKQRGQELTRVNNINNKQQQTKEEFKKYEKDISQQQ